MSTTLQIDGRTLITCQDAARLYGCTMGYIRRLARNGRIYSQMIGRTYLVDAADVQRISDSAGKLAKGFSRN